MEPLALITPHIVPTIAISTLLALAMVVLAALKGWQGWLSLKERELDMRPQHDAPSTASRIELADLKERIRKLEAIASGVDL